MTELEDYQDYIQRSHNAFCKIVIRHAAIDIALRLRKQWEKELSLEYLMFEKFVPFSTTDEYFKEPEPCEEYPFTVCGQTVILYDGELAAALSLLPEQALEEVFAYYFQRKKQREIAARYGQTRSTAGRHIQLALQQLPYETIVKACEGDPAAMQAVLDRYAGFIRYFSHINGYYNADMENYIKTKLIESQFKFRFDR